MDTIKRRPSIFHPATVLAVSCLAAGIFALFVTLLFEGESRWFLLYYFTPIGIPFVAFLFDRAEHYALAPRASWAVDLGVLIPSLTRAFVRLPLISGHALFLTYCLLTSRSKIARITAALVLLQVAYLKLFVTHDTALFGGMVAGCLAAFMYRRVNRVEGYVKELIDQLKLSVTKSLLRLFN
jgi:hypothetical protein